MTHARNALGSSGGSGNTTRLPEKSLGTANPLNSKGMLRRFRPKGPMSSDWESSETSRKKSVSSGSVTITSRPKRAEVRPDTISLYQLSVRQLIRYFGGYTPLKKIQPRLTAKFIAELEPINPKRERLSS